MGSKPDINLPIRYLKGVGPKREELFLRLGISTVRQLLCHFPFRYEDRRAIKKIKELILREPAVVKATIKDIRALRAFYGRKSKVEAFCEDESGSLSVLWFNQPYITQYIKKGMRVIFFGVPQYFNGRLAFICPEFEEDDARDSLTAGRIVPVYSSTQGLTQKLLRRLVFTTLEQYARFFIETIPFGIRNELKLTNVVESLLAMHFPKDPECLKAARRRFIFEDFFISQILVYRQKRAFRSQKKVVYCVNEALLEKARKNFGFELTHAQQKVFSEILHDMLSPYRMYRLLQGDVGSGKTIVAGLASILAAGSGYQAAFLVPTEIVARQHFETFKKLAKGLGIVSQILTGSLTPEEKEGAIRKIKDGTCRIIVGTHALLEETIVFRNLGLVVIDEEQRFGVEQRLVLYQKDLRPDILIMTATPIPRSLALSIYGDLDISIIDAYPQGRVFPKSLLVFESKRSTVYGVLKKLMREGRQVYVVCPLIEDSGEASVYSAETMYEVLSEEFKDFRLGLLHGELTAQQKEKTIHGFQKGSVHMLVTTSVVEVGVDIPNATCMVVESPERFGLSQLHQLRGRIMRSSFQSYFFMVAADDIPQEAYERLQILTQNQDGFVISEHDLKLRGPGDIFGKFQHGYHGKSLVTPLDDLETMKKARFFAYHIIKSDPELSSREHLLLSEQVKQAQAHCALWQESI